MTPIEPAHDPFARLRSRDRVERAAARRELLRSDPEPDDGLDETAPGF